MLLTVCLFFLLTYRKESHITSKNREFDIRRTGGNDPMDVHVMGVALHPAALRIGDKRLEEVVFDTAHDALCNAGISRAELDHVTIPACDELDGRSISSMLLAAPAGSYLKDEIKVTDSGMIGLCMETLRLSSGRFDLGIVASWNKSSKGPLEHVMRMRCEP